MLGEVRVEDVATANRVVARNGEVGVVGDVESLPTKFEACGFGQLSMLGQAEVEEEAPWLETRRILQRPELAGCRQPEQSGNGVRVGLSSELLWARVTRN